MANTFDEYHLSWLYWPGCDFWSISDKYKAELARSYASSVAGDLISISFDVDTHDFDVIFVVQETGGVTELFLSEDLHYPNGFKVTLSACDYTKPSRSRLEVKCSGHEGQVKVTVRAV